MGTNNQQRGMSSKSLRHGKTGWVGKTPCNLRVPASWSKEYSSHRRLGTEDETRAKSLRAEQPCPLAECSYSCAAGVNVQHFSDLVVTIFDLNVADAFKFLLSKAKCVAKPGRTDVGLPCRLKSVPDLAFLPGAGWVTRTTTNACNSTTVVTWTWR